MTGSLKEAIPRPLYKETYTVAFLSLFFLLQIELAIKVAIRYIQLRKHHFELQD